jgi:hypothetical protein
MNTCGTQKPTRWLKPGVATIALLSLLTIGMHSLNAANVQAEAPTPTLKGQPAAPRRTPALVRLPNSVRTAVLRTHAQQFNLPINTLRVVSFSRESWSDGCLGLGKPEESCLMALVEGWRVEVGSGAERWFYRTDRTGRSVRIEDNNSAASLPQAVGQKVLAIASKDMGVPVNQLRIAAGRSQVWDGCLGVAGPNQLCTMIAISGWQVIVTGPQQYGVYHLNQQATQIKRNPTTSGKGTVIPTFWQPEADATGTNTSEILFQSVTRGGIAGMAYKTMLMKNGQVVRINLRTQPSAAPTVIRQLTPQQVQAFTQILQQNEFSDFLGFNYPTATGADYFTIALMPPGSDRGTQYADMVQDQTPPKLQRIIQAWSRLSSPRR